MTKFDKLKVGSIISEIQYFKVEKIVGDKVQAAPLNGKSVVLDKGYVESQVISADQFTTEKTINKTEAANLLLNNPNTAMEVSFNKQVKPADVKKDMKALYPNKGKIVAQKDFEKSVYTILKGALEGTPRIMRGYHEGNLTELGRVNFIDMEVPKGEHPMRQIDQRSINHIILKGTKYIVK